MSMSATKGLNSRRYAVRSVVMMTACIAALLLAVPLFTFEADARGGGGGGGGGGRGGGGFGGHGIGGHGGFAARGGGMGISARGFGGPRSVGVAHFGGARVGPRSFGVAHVGGSRIAARSFSGHSLAGRPVTSARGVATARMTGSGGRFAIASARTVAAPGMRAAHLGRGVFGNRAIANVAWQIAIRVIAISRQVLRLALVALVARRPRHRLGRTSVLALRLLRFLRLRVLAVRL